MKFFYKIPVNVIITDSWRVSVKFVWIQQGWDSCEFSVMQNYINKYNLNENQFQIIVKKFIDTHVTINGIQEIKIDDVSMRNFLDEEWDSIRNNWKDSIKWIEDIPSPFDENLTKQYIFWEYPTNLKENAIKLNDLLNHIYIYPKAENLLEINQNIKGICDWFRDWDGLDFIELREKYSSLYKDIRDISKKLILKYSYKKYEGQDSLSFTTSYMLYQTWLFDNEDFTNSERKDNSSFLDSLVENWMVNNLLIDSETPSDYKLNLTAKIEQFSSYKDFWSNITSSWKFKWGDNLKELTVQDFISVIYSDFEKELLTSNGESYLSFKTALIYFYNLYKSNDSIKPIITDITYIFKNFSADYPEEIWYFTSLNNNELVKILASIFIKTIIVEKLKKENLLENFFKNNTLTSQYYWKMSDPIISKLFTLLSGLERQWNSIIQEIKAKWQKLSSFFNKEIRIGDNFTKTNFAADSIWKLFHSVTDIWIEDLLKKIKEASEKDKSEILKKVLSIIQNKTEFNDYIFNLFTQTDITLQKSILNNLPYLTDILFAEKLFTLYFGNIQKYREQITQLLFGDAMKRKYALINKIFSIWDKKQLSNYIISLWSQEMSDKKEELFNFYLGVWLNYIVKEDLIKFIENLDKESPYFIENNRQNILEICSNLLTLEDIETLAKNVKKEDLIQTLFELIWKNWYSSSNKGIYIKKILDWMSYDQINSNISIEELNRVLGTMSWNSWQNLLNLFESMSWEKVDAFKFLTLMEGYHLLDNKTLDEKIKFYYSFIDVLSKWDYETKDLVLSRIYKKMFAPESKDFLFQDMITSFENVRKENQDIANDIMNSFKIYMSASSTKKSLIKNLWGSIKGEEPVDLEKEYINIKNKISMYSKNINKNSDNLSQRLKEIIWTVWEIAKFKETVSKIPMKDNIFMDWIKTFEGNILWIQTRLETQINMVNDLFIIIDTLNIKLQTVDKLVWGEVIAAVWKDLENRFKTL